MAGQARGRSLGIHPEGVPLVSTTDRASDLLGIPADRLGLAITAAGLQPRATHASGAPAWSWQELLTVARSLGVQPPPALDRDQRRRVSPLQTRQERGRRNRYSRSSSGHPGR